MSPTVRLSLRGVLTLPSRMLATQPLGWVPVRILLDHNLPWDNEMAQEGQNT